jgi:uncharacterized membrane protein HdeD (DUF308 family)
MSRQKLFSGNWLLLSGIVLVILGLAAISSPSVAGEAVIYVIGGLLTITGLIQVWVGVREETTSGKVINTIQGVLVGIAGIAVLAYPFYGLAALSLVLAIYFLVAGFWRILTSFAYRPAAGWLALLLSGVIALVLAWMIWRQWPISGLWAVGILVGVDLISTGLALIILAITLKKTARLLRGAAEAVKEQLASRSSDSQGRS